MDLSEKPNLQRSRGTKCGRTFRPSGLGPDKRGSSRQPDRRQCTFQVSRNLVVGSFGLPLHKNLRSLASHKTIPTVTVFSSLSVDSQSILDKLDTLRQIDDLVPCCDLGDCSLFHLSGALLPFGLLIIQFQSLDNLKSTNWSNVPMGLTQCTAAVKLVVARWAEVPFD